MLASEMSQRGFDVSIVDSDPTAFKHLDTDFNGLTFASVPVVKGDGTSKKVLERAGFEELIPLNDGKAAVFELTIPENYVYSGKELSDIRLPDNCNIVSITRGDSFIIPRGKTKVMSNDVLLIVTAANEVRRTFKIKNNT